MENMNTQVQEPSPQAEQAELDRQKVMAKMQRGPMLNAISRSLLIVAAPILSVGLFGLISGSIVAATAWPLILGSIFVSLTGVAIDYYSSRNNQDAGFDQMDVGAKTKAKCMVKEMESHGLVMVPKSMVTMPENEPRKDGKTWVAATTPVESAVVQR